MDGISQILQQLSNNIRYPTAINNINVLESLPCFPPKKSPTFPSRGTSFERQISRLIFEFGQGLDGMKDGVLREIGCQEGKDVETCDKKRVIFCFDSEQSLVGRVFN